MAKKRLDVLLFERGLAPSRERAKTTIMEGLVYVNGQKADKAGENVAEDAQIEVRSTGKDFVSRGGKKIEKALGRAGLHGYWRIYRGFYRLFIAARRSESVCH